MTGASEHDPGATKFIADRMLGKLAKKLRMLGYDTIYFRGEEADSMMRLARQQGRIVLTRSASLAPRRSGDVVLQLKEDDPRLQLRELIEAGKIEFDEERVFSRCLLCNAVLLPVARKDVEGRVPDFVFHQQRNFFHCPQCQRVYWPGSHQENMRRWVEELFIGPAKAQEETSEADSNKSKRGAET